MLPPLDRTNVHASVGLQNGEPPLRRDKFGGELLR
jgi:hypothetical protein